MGLRDLSLSMQGFPYDFPITFPGADTRDFGSYNSQGFPYTFPVVFTNDEGSRELSDPEE